MRTIVILGGAQAGPTAAARAREIDEKARIVLCERGRDVSYAVAGLAFHLAGEVSSIEDLNREKADLLRDVYGVEVRRTGVSRIDAKKKLVELGGEQLEWDSLVYALGAESPVPAEVEGAKNVFRFRTLRDLEAILAAIDAGQKRVAILGGGFFGVEAADGLARRGCEVTLVERGPRVLGSFAELVSLRARDALLQLGVSVRTETSVLDTRRSREQILELELQDGGRLQVDFVIAAAGLSPRTQLLGEAGGRLHPDGSAKVDAHLQTSLKGIFACGVCVGVEHAITGRHALTALAAIVDKTAQVAGANAGGAKLRMPPVLGSAIVRVGDTVCARTGIGVGDLGPGISTARVHAPSHDPFFAGSSPVSIELYYDEKTGRVLGADLVGSVGVDKRVDVLATAIAGKLGVDDLADLDLAYAPPFSTARDAVNVAANVGRAQRESKVRAWSARELRGDSRAVALVDVRPESGGELPNAVSIPLAELRKRMAELPKGKLVFFDESGRAGYLAAMLACQHGLKNAGYLSGGLLSLRSESDAR